MDIQEHSLDTESSQSKQEEEEGVGISGVGEEQTAAFVDHNIQYQFRPEGSQVTYRVVAVAEPQPETRDNTAVSVVSTATFAGAPQNTFSDVSPVGGEARFTYFPAAAVSDVHATSDPSLTPAGGQFYVMMSPSDVIPAAGRNLTSHAYSPEDGADLHDAAWKMEGARTPRDQKRRAQHNEVERRRRDKINNWIVSLSQIIPDCTLDSTKTGASKGGILSKACDYITDLRKKNQQLAQDLKEMERIQTDNQLYRQQSELPSHISSPVGGWRGLGALRVCGSRSHQQKEQLPPSGSS
ncbi:upstream stimulatory factor 2 isoform X1 [Gadus morhua]|uniref:upstream stimulatory factor 2 isoform X1 n=1 Tax=Gadus morhua TaxID=8049 RepID=UPI0011B4C957|nr:upstream stimulatory factor 2-like isoform X1 [Gadus morhua]